MPFYRQSPRKIENEMKRILVSSESESESSASDSHCEATSAKATNPKHRTGATVNDQNKKTEPLPKHNNQSCCGNEPPTKLLKCEEAYPSMNFQNEEENDMILNISEYLKIKMETGTGSIIQNMDQNNHIIKTEKKTQDLFRFKIEDVADILKKFEPESYSIKAECQIKSELVVKEDPADQIPYRRTSNLICPICLEEFTANRSKRKHMQDVHLVDIHCADLTSSGKVVVGNNCEFCCQKYERSDTKKRHKRRDHFTLWVRCRFNEECKAQCWLGSELLDHLWTCHDARLSKDNYYFCVICQRNNFFNAGQLDQHTFQAHKDTPNFHYSLPNDIPFL